MTVRVVPRIEARLARSLPSCDRRGEITDFATARRPYDNFITETGFLEFAGSAAPTSLRGSGVPRRVPLPNVLPCEA